MNIIVKASLTRQRIGVQFGGEIISIECFTGDIVIITESEGDSQRVIDKMDGSLRTLEVKRN